MKSFRLFKSVSLPFLFSFALAASGAPQDILLNPRLRNQKPTPPPTNPVSGPATSDPVAADAGKQIAAGRQVFRFNTFGDEEFWGGALRLHEAIAGQANGGAGDGLSPTAALALGLKVDADALPQALKQQLRQREVNLNDPAVTLALLKLNAVVGAPGFFTNGTLQSVGITCALCHSTVWTPV